MSGCLGDVAAALVDGELDHASRERAHRHLAHCDACRAEVDAQRRLKSRLSALDEPAPSDALTARLRALSARGDAVVRPVEAGAGPVRPVSVRPAARAAASSRPAGRRPRSLRRRAAAGSAFAVLGVAAALALGSPPPRPASTPFDPGTDAFVTQFVGTNDGGAGSAVRTASLTGAPTTGGARSPR